MRALILLTCMLILGFVVDYAYGSFLAPEPDRITDEAIAADLKTIDTLQARLAQVNSQKKVPIASYHFAKAQAWIDFGRDEYTVNDRSTVIEETLQQAHNLILDLEAGKKDIPMATPIIPTSKLVRPDMWELAEKLKKHEGFHCGEHKVAQFEVQLVWSGHEEAEMGWRHSKPYLQAAERLAKEAETLIYACKSREEALSKLPPCVDPLTRPGGAAVDTTGDELGSPAVGEIVTGGDKKPGGVAVSKVLTPQPAVPEDKAPEAVASEVVSSQLVEPLPDRVHFALDKSHLSVKSALILDRVVKGMMSEPNLKIELRGHTDERADNQYNLKLSQRRSETVRQYLIAAGIAPERIAVKAFGESMPISTARNVEVYAKNRRVEFFFTSCDGPPVEGQTEDLQVEKVKRKK